MGGYCLERIPERLTDVACESRFMAGSCLTGPWKGWEFDRRQGVT